MITVTFPAIAANQISPYDRLWALSELLDKVLELEPEMNQEPEIEPLDEDISWLDELCGNQ